MAKGIGGPSSFGSGGAHLATRAPSWACSRSSVTGTREHPFGLTVIEAGRAIRELPPSERPRERLQLRGPAGLTAAELIGLLWGSGSRRRSAAALAGDTPAPLDGLTGLS